MYISELTRGKSPSSVRIVIKGSIG
ncbi:UNVERIFIED_CONTAM: hypothetical protein GTU68_031796 [Idotea baltica]|nr:hypothetical protein [Idotea baltica]